MGEESRVRQVLQDTIASGAMGNLRVDPQYLRISALRGMAPPPLPHPHTPSQTFPESYPSDQGNYPSYPNIPSQGSFNPANPLNPSRVPGPPFNPPGRPFRPPGPPFRPPGSFRNPIPPGQSLDKPQNSSPSRPGVFIPAGGRYLPYGPQGTYLLYPWNGVGGRNGGGWGSRGPQRIVFPQ